MQTMFEKSDSPKKSLINDRAQAMVEFAIVAPILFLLLFGVIDDELYGRVAVLAAVLPQDFSARGAPAEAYLAVPAVRKLVEVFEAKGLAALMDEIVQTLDRSRSE